MLVLLPAVALAAPVVDPFEEPDDADLYRLEERIVTVAARYAQTARDAPAIVTVVTDREIRERGYRTLADALRAMPGVYVTVSNESRQVAWFRGVTSADTNKVLLLVDGQPWYDGVYTHAPIDEYLPLENVRQIEIIKGPGSAVYGTNAFSGVINIVTYAPADLKGGFARAWGGTAFRHGAAAVAGLPFEWRGRRGGVGAFVRYADEEGDGLDVTPRGRRNVSGTDPTRTTNAGLRLQLGGAELRFDLVDHRTTYFVNEQDDALDIFTQDADDFWLKYQDRMLAFRWGIQAAPALRITPRLSWRGYDDPGQYAWFSDPAVDAETGEVSWDTTLVETFKETGFLDGALDLELRPAASHVLVGGVGGGTTHVVRIEDVYYEDRAHDRADGYTYEAPETWITAGYAFLQDTWSVLPWLSATGGARLDVHQFYGVFPSPRAGLLLVPNDATTVKLLYGRAFRAPTAREWLVEVESDAEGHNLFTAGNPELRPERIHTLEAEASVTPRRDLELRAAGFWSSIEDEINKVSDAPDPQLGDAYYTNSGGSTVLGGEAEAAWTGGPVELAGSYSYTHGVDRDTGYRVYEFPPHMGHLRVGWRIPDVLRATISADAVGKRPRAEWSPDAGAEDGPAYVLVNAGLATDAIAGGRVRVDVAATNLLDSETTTLVYRDDANALDDGARKYPNDLQGPGRQVTVGVEVAF